MSWDPGWLEAPVIKVEYSPSGRARCRECSTCIDLGCVRVGQQDESPEYGTYYKWFHLSCFNFKAAHIKKAQQITGVGKLSREDKDLLKNSVRAQWTPARGAGGIAAVIFLATCTSLHLMFHKSLIMRAAI